MSKERELLVDYVRSGKLMQVATITDAGTPMVCSVWYRAAFNPDRLWWISHPGRVHSINIRQRPTVAGAIVAIELDGLGDTVPRGVQFEGTTMELPAVGTTASEAIAGFVQRWPNAAHALDLDRLASGESPTRLYRVDVTAWVLFDEENFPDQPRREISPPLR